MKLLMVKRMVCQLCGAEIANGMEGFQHLEKKHAILREQVVVLNHEEWVLADGGVKE